MKVYVNPRELDSIPVYCGIEKARKGEQIGGQYIYRENITEKVTTTNGKKTVRRYNYYYAKDLIKDTAEKILENIGKFFFKGKPEEIKKIDESYSKENIQEKYGADKKTFFQHVCEYFAHRTTWDKRFSKKEVAKKWEKPVKMETADKLNNDGMDSPLEEKPEIKTNAEPKKKTEKVWKPNPSLMRKIWSMYTGKDQVKEEKKDGVIEDVINEPVKEEKKKTPTEILKEIKPLLRQMQIIPSSQIDATTTEMLPEVERLITQIQNMPGLYENETQTAYLHYFTGGIDYYICEFNPETGEAYGYTDNNGDSSLSEYGYIMLDELAKMDVMIGGGKLDMVNIDYYFTPKNVADCIKESGHRELYDHYMDIFGEEDEENTEEEIEETEAEKHENRSQAMMGNQNAKKWQITDDEYKALKDYIKANDITDRDALKTITNMANMGYNVFNEFSVVDMSNIILDIKDEIEGEKNDGKNNIETERSGLSGTVGTLRPGNNTVNGNQDVRNTEIAGNGGESLHDDSESGIGLGSGRLTKTQAKKIREKCREILQKPDSEITAEDKIILAQYEGAGGLNEGDQTDAAVLSEFYTPRDVIKKVWQLVDKYNPNKNKKVIEPSSGIGRFAEGRTEDFTLCELDETSARIAKLLHPDADVKQGAFQKLFVKNNSVQKDYKGEKYDVAVGNPPYGDYTGLYKGLGEGKYHTRYEEYFIDRTLDTLKDGGIMAFVVPSGFLRNGSSKAKEIIASKGKLLEAWRLPKGTFSSTDVGTDIIVIRKEKGNVEDFTDNNYFNTNDSHVIGYETDTGNWGTTVVNLPEGKTVEEAIDMIDVNAVEVDKQIAEINKDVESVIEEPKKVASNYVLGDEIETEKGKGKVTGFKKKNGKTTGYIVRVGEERLEIPAETEAEKHQNRSEAMKGNKNAEKLVHAEKKKKIKEGDLYTVSTGKNMTAEEFSKRFGKDVPEQDFKFWKKTNWEGIIEKNELTPAEIKEIDKNQNFIKVNGNYINVVNFASGNIYKKLEDLELQKETMSKEDFELKKSLLEAALPARKNVQQFTVSPVSNFSKLYQDDNGKNLLEKFLSEYVGFNDWGGTYGIRLSRNELDDNVTWNDIWDYCHQKPVKTERSRDEAEQETNKMIAEQKKQARRENCERLFNDFLRKLPASEQQKVEDAWNKQFNAIVNPDFKKIPLFVEGMNTHKGSEPFSPTDQQMKGISELCNKGNGILAYDVGVGKTFCGIVATVNQLQTGKSKHPLIMVPKKVYKKWIKEIHQHFPDIPINELGNFSKNDLDKFKKGEKFEFPYGLNVCTYEALQKITFKDETLQGELRDDMLDSQSIYDYDENGNLIADTRSEREKAEANEKIMKMLGKSAKAKDDAVFWEDLGIDHITVDELHNFKNVFSIPRNIGKSVRSSNESTFDMWGRKQKPDDDPGRMVNEFQGLSGASSARGMKMFAISQLIQRETNGRGFFGLSATPFNNSPIEIYNIMSLVARNRLKELNIFNLQDFLREFAELKPDWKVDAKGNVSQSQTMKNFKNLSALQNLITEFIDKVDGEEAGVIRPRKQLHMPELDLTPLQKRILEAEKMRMDGYFSKGLDGKPTGDVLVAMNNMRMATLSPSLIDPKFFADYESIYDDWEDPKLSDIVKESPKLTYVCDSVAKLYKDRPTEGQVIYMPRGVEQFSYVKEYLVENGLPEDSVAFMNADTKLEEAERIMSDFNNPDGKIKVIIGSEAIKEGVSLNGNSTTLYNTMLGWNPTETIQVEGRIWRQGNKQGITHIVYPLMNDSIDSMMYQKYDEKSSRLNALWSYKGDSLNVEEYDPEEVKYQLIKDPEKRANMKVLQDQADLKKQLRIQNAQYDNMYNSRSDYQNYLRRIQSAENDLKEAENYANERQQSVETAKQEVDKAKKTLAAAKKAKDDDLIEMANAKIERTETELTRAKDSYDRAKSEFKMAGKSLKEYNEKREAIEVYWKKQGIENPNEIDSKLEEISQSRQKLQSDIDAIKDKREEYVAEARRQLEAEKASQKHETVDQVVNQVVKDITNNLRPMDDKLKAEIRGELEEKYPHLKKSLPLIIVQKGRIFIKKHF